MNDLDNVLNGEPIVPNLSDIIEESVFLASVGDVPFTARSVFCNNIDLYPQFPADIRVLEKIVYHVKSSLLVRFDRNLALFLRIANPADIPLLPGKVSHEWKLNKNGHYSFISHLLAANNNIVSLTPSDTLYFDNFEDEVISESICHEIMGLQFALNNGILVREGDNLVTSPEYYKFLGSNDE